MRCCKMGIGSCLGRYESKSHLVGDPQMRPPNELLYRQAQKSYEVYGVLLFEGVRCMGWANQ